MSDTHHMTEALTNREHEVAAAYAAGQSYKEIARALSISPTTVRSHLRAVYRKLGVTSKIELVNYLSDQDATPAPGSRDEPSLVAELALELDEAIRRERVLANVLSIISRQGDQLDATMDEVLDHALEICDAEFGLLFEYVGDLRYRVLRSRNISQPFANWLDEQGVFAVEPDTGLGRIAATMQAVNIADVRGEDVYRSGAALRVATADLGNARSFAAIPMLSGNRLIGAFTVYRTRVHPFSDRALELGRLFADQAAIAIQNARLQSAARPGSPSDEVTPGDDSASNQGSAPPRLLAILPFRNVDGSDSELERTGRMLSASVQMELSSSPLFRLVDQASSSVDALATTTPAKAASMLGADLIVTGTIRRNAARGYRIALSLYEGGESEARWADRLDEPEDGTRALLDTLISRLCAAIDGNVGRQMLAGARRRHTDSQTAMDHFVQGLALHHRHDASDFKAARSHFEAAVSKDPGFGRAAAALAITYVREWFWQSQRTDLLDLAEQHARLAMGTTPHDAWTQTVWGVVALYKRRHNDAEQSFKRALELAPYDTYVVSRCGLGKLYSGHFDEAAMLFQQALALDPLHSDRHRGFLGHALFHGGRYDEAIEFLEGIAEPLAWELAWLAACYAEQGQSEAAAETAARFRASFESDEQAYQVETRPFRNSADRARLENGLALAGIWPMT